MTIIDRLRISTLAAWSLITLLLVLVLASPYLPHTVLHAQSVGPGGVPGAGGGAGGAVSSVFGRTGAVVAASGDYTAAQVTNAAATNVANAFTATNSQAAGTYMEFLASAAGAREFGITSQNSANFGVLNIVDLGYGDNWFSLVEGGPGLGGYYALSNAGFLWSSQSANSDATPDTGLTRPVADTIDCGNALTGDSSCTFNAGTVNSATELSTPNLTLGGVPITQAATQPTGSCSAIAWVLSNDGHITFCNGTAYVSKV